MRVTIPLAVTDARLTSSTAAEPAAGETAWVSAGTYALGDRRIRTTTHRVYEALQGHTGRTALPEVDAAYWQDVGPTNKWAMFDLLRNSATVLASPLTVVLTPAARVNSIGLVGLEADTLTISVTDGVSVVWSRTTTLTLRHTRSWSEYFFGAFLYRSNVVFYNIPQFTGAVITITLTKASGSVKCGGVVIGKAVNMGTLLSEPANDGLNFSKITRDAFGNATLVPRRTVPKTDLTLLADRNMFNTLDGLRNDLNATPALYSGMDGNVEHDYFDGFLILGVYQQFRLTPDANHIKVALTLEEI